MRTKELANEFLAVPQVTKLDDARVALSPVVRLAAPATVDEAIRDRLTRRGIAAPHDEAVSCDAGKPKTLIEVEIAPRTPWRNESGGESYRLEIRAGSHGSATIRLAGGSARAVMYGMQAVEAILASGEFQTGVIEDWPSFPARGVVEGFYGRPWTNAERLRLIDFLAEHRFNHYIYAPKADPYHRSKWRDPYPAVDMAMLQEQVERCRRNHVTWVFAVSPGLSLQYSSTEDLGKLIAKLESVYHLGCRDFGLFFDDVPLDLESPADQRAFASLADAQVSFVGELYRHFQAMDDHVHFFLCPTIYAGVGDSDYLRRLGANLPAGVDIFWTGPAICSDKVPTELAVRMADVLGRPPILWDNYPVNDGLMAAELHLAPYAGRDEDLHRSVRGVFANPMTLARASEIPLACVGAYAWNPRRYRAGTVWSSVIDRRIGANAAAYRQFAACNPMSCLYEQPKILIEAVDAFRGEFWSGDFHGAIARLESFFVEMEENLQTLLLDGLEPALLDEVRPWIEDALLWSSVGQKAAACWRTAVEILTAEGQHPAAELVVEHHRAAKRGADGVGAAPGKDGSRAERGSGSEASLPDPTSSPTGADARATYGALREELRRSVDLRTKACGYVIRDFAQDAVHALVAVSRDLRPQEDLGSR